MSPIKGEKLSINELGGKNNDSKNFGWQKALSQWNKNNVPENFLCEIRQENGNWGAQILQEPFKLFSSVQIGGSNMRFPLPSVKFLSAIYSFNKTKHSCTKFQACFRSLIISSLLNSASIVTNIIGVSFGADRIAIWKFTTLWFVCSALCISATLTTLMLQYSELSNSFISGLFISTLNKSALRI